MPIFPRKTVRRDEPADGRHSSDHFDTAHLENDLKGRSIRGGAITIIGQGGRFFLQIGSTIVLARLLTPSAFGLIAMVTAVTGFARLFKDLGLSTATIQKATITHRQISSLFWINVAISGLLALITAGLAPVVAWFYGEPELALVTAVLTVSFLFGGLTVQHQALLNRQMRFLSLTVINVLAMLAGVGAAVVAALLGAGYWALVIKELVMAFTIMLGVWIVCPWRPGMTLKGEGIREMLHFGADLTGFNILNYLAKNIDYVLIGKVWGAAPLGFYTKAYSLLRLPLNQINAPLHTVVVPTLSRLQNDPGRYRSYYMKTLTLISFLMMPNIMYLILMADEVILVVLGPQWSEAGRIFSVLGIAGLLQPASNSTGWLLISQGRSRDMFKWGIIGSAITIAAIVIGLPWGAFGVAVSYSLFSMISCALLFRFVGRKGPVKSGDFYRAISVPAVITLGVMISLLILKELVPPVHPLLLLLYAFAAMILTGGMLILLLPGGRRLWRDVVMVTGNLIGRAPSKKAQAAEPGDRN